MNPSRALGLGEPEPTGKRALFQPPDTKPVQPEQYEPEIKEALPTNPKQLNKPPKRVRTTIDLTREALQIIQDLQQRHRLQTGRVLPLWKAVSRAIEAHGKVSKQV